MKLSKRTCKRLNAFPTLQFVVNNFIETNGDGGFRRLTPLTVYIRMLKVFEPDLFGWSNYIFEEFCSWGHNSRYANVLEPMLCNNLNLHVCKILNYLESNNITEPSVEFFKKEIN